jgi:hypothetical protein
LDFIQPSVVARSRDGFAIRRGKAFPELVGTISKRSVTVGGEIGRLLEPECQARRRLGQSRGKPMLVPGVGHNDNAFQDNR